MIVERENRGKIRSIRSNDFIRSLDTLISFKKKKNDDGEHDSWTRKIWSCLDQAISLQRCSIDTLNF